MIESVISRVSMLKTKMSSFTIPYLKPSFGGPKISANLAGKSMGTIDALNLSPNFQLRGFSDTHILPTALRFGGHLPSLYKASKNDLTDSLCSALKRAGGGLFLAGSSLGADPGGGVKTPMAGTTGDATTAPAITPGDGLALTTGERGLGLVAVSVEENLI